MADDLQLPPTPPSSAPGSLPRTLGLVACLLLILVIAVSGVLAFVARQRGAQIGFDVANGIAFGLILLSAVCALLVVFILLLIRRGRTFRQKLASVSVLVLAVCGGALAARYTVRVDGFTGRLVPVVRWRWDRRPEPVTLPPRAGAATPAIDLATSGPTDFPQFLGPQRDLHLPGVYLERDWGTHLPQQLWRIPLGAGWSGFSVVNGYAVTLEQRGADEVLTCYEAETGQLVWAHSIPARHETVLGGLGPRSTPTIDSGLVYALGATGKLRCVDGSNGRLVWSQDLLKLAGTTEQQDLQAVAWGRSASPLVVDQLVVVPLGGPPGGPCYSLAAFDKTTGLLLWQGGDQQVGYASPSYVTLCGRPQLLIMNEASVSGHELSDGKVLWSYPWEGQSNGEANCSQPVALPGDRLLLSGRRKCEVIQLGGSGSGLVADRVWSGAGKLKTKFTNVVVHDGYAYGLSDGILECVDVETGQRSWKSRRGDYGHGQLLGVGDLLLVQAEDGDVVLVDCDPDDLVELGRLAALSDVTWNTPCLAGPLLLVRNRSEAACYRLALRPAGAE